MNARPATACPSCADIFAASGKVIRQLVDRCNAQQAKLDAIAAIVADWKTSPVVHGANIALHTISEILEEP